MQTRILITLITLTVIFTSCKKNGTGGQAEIHALIYHGTTPIVGTTTLYVKFDSKSQPSNPTTNFDLKVLGEVDDNHVHVLNMRPGDYYLYAVAYDSIAKTPVSGGVATTVTWSERKKLKEVTVETN